MKNRAWTVAVMGVALLFPLVGNSSPQDELRIALNAEFETINPLINTMMTGVMVQDAVLRPLVKLTPAGKPEAVLIKEIPSIDKKTATLFTDKTGQHLRTDIEFIDAKWGDGQPVTCKDLEASWAIGNSSLIAIPNREDYRNISSIQIDSKNPKKCSVVFEKPQYNFYLNFPRPVPAHLELPVFEKFKAQAQGYEHNSNYVSKITSLGLYNGPYRVSELKFGSHVILVPNENFYGKKPSIKKIIFRFILNSSTMEANLLSGNVHMTSSSGMSFDQSLSFQKKIAAQKLPFEVQFVPGTMYSHVEINVDDAVLKDKKIRHALAYSFNRKEMAQSFFEGKQPPAFHFSTPFDEWYTESPNDIQLYNFSKRKAAELFDQAGWKMSSSGLRMKDGQKLSFVLSGVSDNKLNEMLAVYLQNQWRQVGVELTIKNYPARVFFAEILKRRNFQLALLTWVNPPNYVSINSLSSNMIPSAANGWAGHNRAGWKNKQVDAWLTEANQEFDTQKRVALMRKVLGAYTEDLPALPAYYRSNTCVIPKGLKGYEMSGHNFTEFLQVENWHF